MHRSARPPGRGSRHVWPLSQIPHGSASRARGLVPRRGPTAASPERHPDRKHAGGPRGAGRAAERCSPAPLPPRALPEAAGHPGLQATFVLASDGETCYSPNVRLSERRTGPERGVRDGPLSASFCVRGRCVGQVRSAKGQRTRRVAAARRVAGAREPPTGHAARQPGPALGGEEPPPRGHQTPERTSDLELKTPPAARGGRRS